MNQKKAEKLIKKIEDKAINEDYEDLLLIIAFLKKEISKKISLKEIGIEMNCNRCITKKMVIHQKDSEALSEHLPKSIIIRLTCPECQAINDITLWKK